MCYLRNEKINSKLKDMKEYKTLQRQRKILLGRSYAYWVSTVKEITELVYNIPHPRVLDVGCGTGNMALELARLKNINVYGIDFVKKRIELLKKRIEINDIKNLRPLSGDATCLPFKNEIFDVVISLQFFEHVTNKEKAIGEQIRVLKEGGKLFIDQANFMSLRSFVNQMILYPLRTKGGGGGLKWLLTKEKIINNYHYGKPGRDEDVKSLLWWYKKIKEFKNVKIDYIHTPLSKKFKIEDIYLKSFISFFSRNIHIVCTKLSGE